MLGHYLKIWADKWACTGEVKGGTVPLNHHRFIVTSNYSINEIYGPDGTENDKMRRAKEELVKAIERRFKVRYIINKDSPLFLDEPEEEVKSPVHKRVAHMFLRDVKTGEVKITPQGPTISANLAQHIESEALKRVDTTLPFHTLDDMG